MKGFKVKKLNNQGSALVVAIIAVGFISILATLLLYSANMNYHMKGTDYYVKQTFYEAEEPLEQIRACLAKDVSTAAQEAYLETIKEFGRNNSDARTATFYSKFSDEFQEIWTNRSTYTPPSGTPVTSYAIGVAKAIEETAGMTPLGEYHILITDASIWDETNKTCLSSSCGKDYHILLDPVSGLDRLEERTVNGNDCLVFDNVRVIYTCEEYTSIITTDFCISCPTINWGVQQTQDNSDPVVAREEVNFERFVTYMDWEKQ